jgi:hypothetical protein
MHVGCRNATIHRSVNEIIQLVVAGLEDRAIDAQACAYFRQHFFDLTLEVSPSIPLSTNLIPPSFAFRVRMELNPSDLTCRLPM